MPEYKEEVVNKDSITSYSEGYFAHVRFTNGGRAFFFHTYDDSLKIDDKVVVETIRGMEIGYICAPLQEVKQLKREIPLKPIVRKATEFDIRNYDNNLLAAQRAEPIIAQSIENFQLDMRIIDVVYTLDAAKLIISYVSDSRVDFRELLKDLAIKFRCRIELRQIGTRDRSKAVSGIAVCGLPLCCATFLNEFDGISINMAKNQCLALNIQKLSGHCGKLICCLKYEDDAYTLAKKDFPKVGQRITYDNQEYRISGFNILANTVRLENSDNIVTISVDALKNERKN